MGTLYQGQAPRITTFGAQAGRAITALAATGIMTFACMGSANAETAVPDPADYGGSVVSTAGDVQIVDSGTTAVGGWVEYTGDGEVTVTPTSPAPTARKTTVKVGGGTWTYGTGVNAGGQKTCSSKYLNNSRRHTATVTMAGKSDTEARPAGTWATANVGAWSYGKKSICKAFWSNL